MSIARVELAGLDGVVPEELVAEAHIGVELQDEISRGDLETEIVATGQVPNLLVQGDSQAQVCDSFQNGPVWGLFRYLLSCGSRGGSEDQSTTTISSTVGSDNQPIIV